MGSGVAVDNKEETCIEMFHLVFVIILSILDLVWRLLGIWEFSTCNALFSHVSTSTLMKFKEI
jgi:hypothetical protein